MTGWQMAGFIVAALMAGGLSMGGVTWLYFRDKWREDPEPGGSGPRPPSPFDRAV